MNGITAKKPSQHAVLNKPNQGGNKAAERPGAGKGITERGPSSHDDPSTRFGKARKAMAAMGHTNVRCFDGGEK